MPEIEHIVVCMLENHSYDNFFGMLGRAPGQTPRGDGFVIDDPTPTACNPYGTPTFTNPYANGDIQLAFHMPSTCQNTGGPGQEWKTSHDSYADGACNGFVTSASGPVSMGYWTGADLPFTYALADTFPIGDRWFCSLLGQTDPNRRFLIAATAMGMTDDVGASGVGNLIPDVSLVLPPLGGTIFDILSDHGISWRDYAASYPLGATAALYPVNDLAALAAQTPIQQFFTNCAAGKLPKFCIVDMDYSTQSQENPQNIVVGETFLASVVKAIGASPNWEKTLLDHHLRRARRVLRPRAAAGGPGSRCDPTPGAAGRIHLRGLRPLRVPGSVGGGVPVRQAELRESHRLRPHVDPGDGGAQVEPPGPHLPRRQRQRPVGLPRRRRHEERAAHLQPRGHRRAPGIRREPRLAGVLEPAPGQDAPGRLGPAPLTSTPRDPAIHSVPALGGR